jgi:hypothetical protein
VWSFRTKQSYDLQAGLVGCWGFENSSQIGLMTAVITTTDGLTAEQLHR